MRYCILVIGLIGCLPCLAEANNEPDVKFGSIELLELSAKSYVKDPSAEAVVLYDFGKTNFIYSMATGFDIRFERLTRIKIFSKKGYRWANFEIPLYGDGDDREVLQKIEGFTYNLVEGKIKSSKISKQSLKYEKLSEHWTMVKVIFPEVQEGSIVDLKYTIKTPFTTHLPSWEFQSEIPVAWSEYTVEIPEYYDYLKIVQGYHPFELVEQKRENFSVTTYYEEPRGNFTAQSNLMPQTVSLINYITRLAAKDVPAFRNEEFIARPQDFFLKVEFQMASRGWPGKVKRDILGDWKQIEEALLESDFFGKYLKDNVLYGSLARDIVNSAANDEMKVKSAMSYLSSTVKWNGRNRILASGNQRQLLENKSGSTADINLFLVGLLRELGLQAYPVITSTRSNGKVNPVHPFLDKYNYVLAQVRIDGKEILVDATDPDIPLGLLPERCLNGLGRKIDRESPDWVNMEVIKPSVQFYSVEMKFETDGVGATVHRKAEGYYAVEAKKKLVQDGEEYYRDGLRSIFEKWMVSEINLSSSNFIFNESFKILGEYENGLGSEILYLDPMPAWKVTENPFKQEERVYPIDFRFPTKNVVMTQVTIPDGYRVEELPKQMSFVLPDRGGLFTFTVTSADNLVNIYSQLDLNKTLYLPDQYPIIKAAFDQVIEAHSQQIVLKRL